MRFSTKAVHAGCQPDPLTGAIMTPIYCTSTYVQDAPARHKGYEYSRTGNPTRSALEKSLAALEGATHARAFSSGCAATAAVLHTLKSGDHVVAGDDLYGGSYRLFTEAFQQFGIGFTFVDTTALGAVEAAFTPQTKLLWLETPTNPMLRISDISAISTLAHQRGAICGVDNTFATPYLQNPLALGADLVVHSTTKYLGGHSDVVGGAIMVNDPALDEKLGFYQNTLGAVPGPMDCFLVLRGIKTLAIRMERHCSNARRIASWLAQRSDVKRVHYPGLEAHPGHAVAAVQMQDFGGMISFDLQATLAQSIAFVSATKLFALAESLGGVESLIEHPASMTHAAVPREQRLVGGLEDGLIRLSVGIEDVEDLLEDLERGFAAVV